MNPLLVTLGGLGLIGLVVTVIVVAAMRNARKCDPVYGCDLYRDKGCAHVDGFLCDFPKCSMLADYRSAKNGEQK